MPRIVHVLSAPSGIGGAELLVAALARDAQAAGHEVVVLNLAEEAAMGSALQEACAPVQVRSRPGSRVTSLVPLRAWLGRELERLEPDVVHAHLARASLLVATLRRRPGRHHVLTHHHGLLFADSGRRVAARLDAAAGRRYDVVVAVSPAVRQALVARSGYPPDRVRVIVNGWVGDPLPRSPGDRPLLVCVGRLRPEKGHEVLLRAFAQVLAERPDAHLELLGDGVERDRLTASARRLGIAGSVTFRGAVADVWPSLASATVVVQPSLAETFGIGALEAMAARAPVVASAVGGLPELLDDGRCGVLVPPGDPDALARAIVQLLRDPDRQRVLASAARARAQQLTLASTLAAYRSLYDELLGAPPA